LNLKLSGDDPAMNSPKRFFISHQLSAGKFLSVALFSVIVSAATLSMLPAIVAAQVTPLNFVYTGIGGQSDLIRFTHVQGIFKKYGLDATMIYVVSGVTTTQAVASGSAPMANSNATDGLRAIAAGAPLKIIMVGVDQFQHLFVARSGIKTPKEMKGKRIAVSRYGAFSDIQTRFLVRQWGMDPDRDVQILQIGNSAARAGRWRSRRRGGYGGIYSRCETSRPQYHF
jgi:ABC-type nitrate/sulfonate/bicarbonate transport system substrate-binding protein